MPNDSQSASTDAGEAEPTLRIAVAGDGHRDALHLEARLDDVAERKCGPQALAVALLGLDRVATDQRAVGEEVVAEVLGARVVTRALEKLPRHRLGTVDVAERDEHLADADERPSLSRGVAELAAKLEALLERRQRTGVVAGVVDEGPAEGVEGRRKLVPVAELVPERDRLLELHSPALDVSVPGGESAQRGERASPRMTAAARSLRARPKDARAPPR